MPLVIGKKVKTKGIEQMKKLLLAVGAVLSVGAAFAASYNVSTYDELTNALVSVVQSGDEVVIAASETPYVLAKALTIPAGVTVRGGAGRVDVSDVVGFDGCEHPFSDERIAAE